MDIEIALPANSWEPRVYQRPLWEALTLEGAKRVVAVWHRRAGKDDVALHWTSMAANDVGHKNSIGRVGNYWHMLPEAAQARKAIWDAVNPHSGLRRIDEAFPHELREVTRDNEMMIRFTNGSTWQVIGSDNYNSLVGSPPIGITFSEWALADPNAWAYLRPILAENGGWALFIYTPRGMNHGATFFENHKEDDDWFVQKITAEETNVFTKKQLAAELREYIAEFGPDDGEARFQQEYLCDFNVAVVGSFYGRLMTEAEDAGRITRLLHDPAHKVETWWDLGHSDYTSIWFMQKIANEFHAIDYYESHGEDLGHYARVLKEKAESQNYLYGRHLWPHDGGHKTLASKGRPLSDMMRDLGVTVQVQPRHEIQPGINKVRQIIPRTYFDREKCAGGISSLRQYRKEWNDANKVFKPTPLHDWASHGADAFRTGAMAGEETLGHMPPIEYPKDHVSHGVI